MPLDRRWVIGGAVVVGGGIAFYLYEKSKKTTAAASTATAQPGYGYGYGNSYGYGGGSYGYGAGYGYGSFGGGTGGGTGGYAGGYSGGTNYGYGSAYGYGAGSGSAQSTTNAQWSQNAVSALSGEGYNATSVMAALGQYLMGGSLTSDQQAIVSAAIGAEGYPPQSGANGYPPAMNTSAPSGQSTQGVTPSQPGGGTSSAVAGPISNLQSTAKSKTSFTVRWNPVPGASGYSWVVTQMNGVHVKSGSGSPTTVTVSGLHNGWTYNFGVQALPGGPGNNIHVTTSS